MGSPHRDTEGPARRAPAAAPEHRRGGEGGSLDVEFVAHTSDLPLLGALKNGKKWGKQEKNDMFWVGKPWI